MALILCIDPGPERSGYVRLNPVNIEVLENGVRDNRDMLSLIMSLPAPGFYDYPRHEMVIEMIASYGMAVGAETFETCVWIGRFIDRFSRNAGLSHRVYRKDVKIHLCGSMKAKDANIRQALLDKYPRTGGGKTPQIGTKAQPGPLYGMSSHAWAALAVGVYWAEAHRLVGAGGYSAIKP